MKMKLHSWPKRQPTPVTKMTKVTHFCITPSRRGRRRAFRASQRTLAKKISISFFTRQMQTERRPFTAHSNKTIPILSAASSSLEPMSPCPQRTEMAPTLSTSRHKQMAPKASMQSFTLDSPSSNLLSINIVVVNHNHRNCHNYHRHQHHRSQPCTSFSFLDLNIVIIVPA